MAQEHEPQAEPLGTQLRRLLQSLEAAGRVVLPRSDEALLQSIVEAAARIFGAAAASIALVDSESGTLAFRVACGAGRETVVGMRIPLGQGIAGYVAMTGQPLAISDVQGDARFARDTAQNTGYVPRSILATPLLLGDRVIGVMEVLDKIEAASFGLKDMELLALFARQAALAIDQAQRTEQLGKTLVLGLQRIVSPQGEASSDEAVGELLRAFEDGGDDVERDADILALADMLSVVGALGQAERRMALQVLSVVADYARSRSAQVSRRGRSRQD